MNFHIASDLITYAIDAALIGAALYIPAAFVAHCFRPVAASAQPQGTDTPAAPQRPVQRPTASAEYTVEYVAYCGDTHTIEPTPVAAVKRESITTTDGWVEADAWERPLPPRRILGDVIKPKAKKGLSDMIRSEAARPKTGDVAKVDHTFNLPNNIRGLRAYVRDNGLQKPVKAVLGKGVSNATKAELLAALGKL